MRWMRLSLVLLCGLGRVWLGAQETAPVEPAVRPPRAAGAVDPGLAEDGQPRPEVRRAENGERHGEGRRATEISERRGDEGERSRRREGGPTGVTVPGRFMDRLRQDRPELHERLSRLYHEDRAGFFREVRALMMEGGVPLNEVPAPAGRNRRDPPEERRCHELSQRYRATTEAAEQERLKAELANAIQAAFEARLRASRERITRLEKQLQEFREHLERLEGNRDTICDERLQELTRPTELRWDAAW